MSNKTHGRRRANTRTKTPLTELTEALSANTGVVGKRAAVVAAAGGLVVAAGLPTAVNGAGNDDAGAAKVDKSHSTVDYQAQPAAQDAHVTGGAKGADVSAGALVGGAVKAEKAPTVGSAAGGSTAKSGTDAGKPGKSASIPAAGSRGEKAVAIAKQYVGSPYVWGGGTPSGWDCSDFVSYVYKKLGVSLPHSSSGIKAAGTVISKSQAQPGDIMWHPGHVGIYAGGGKMIDARGKKWGTVYTSAAWMSNAVYVRLK